MRAIDHPEVAVGNPAQDLHLISQACGCADRILQDYMRLPVAKAMRLDSPQEFDRAVARLAAALRAHAEEPEREAVKAALDILDIDWGTTTADQRRELLQRATSAARAALDSLPESARKTFSDAAGDVTGASRRDLRRQGLSIGTEFTALDKRMMHFMTRSQTLFVHDEYGKRVEAFGDKARKAVARGMSLGFGRDDIAEGLAAAAEQTLLRRRHSYWEVVAGAFVGRGRSYAQVGSYAEAGITHYRIEAVLDERTSNVCRFMHGRVFTVRDALHSFEAGDRLHNVEAIKNLGPWPREDTVGLYVQRGPRRIAIAGVKRHGLGKKDDLGEMTTPHSNDALGRLGLGFPPYHGLCRTAVVAH